MSGYFLHGGTQYAYGQPQTQSTGQSGLSSFQQTPQATQFYQNASSYTTGQTSRSILPDTPKNNYGSSYTAPTLSQQSFPAQQRTTQSSYSSFNSGSSSSYPRQSPANDSFTRSSYDAGSSSYGSPAYGAKQEDKYSSGNSYSGTFNKSSPAGGSSFGSSSIRSTGSGSSFFGNQSSFSTSYPSSSYNKPEEASSSQYSYEKALYVAANQYYLNKKAEAARGGGGGASGTRGGRGGGRGRGVGGRGGSVYSNISTGPKVIKATEVKAYLYAWCGQRRLKPEYTIEPMGMPPKMKFCCTLKIAGLDYTAKVTAASKKDSQSKAAWDFCEHLVKTGYMKQSELPDKPVDPAPKNLNPPKPSTPAGTEPSAAESIEESGGWTLENCRQRLNQFTQRWRIPAEFKHETHGPEHARSFVAELSIKIKWLDKEFHARERGNNKKQATAVCALAMIRQLFKEGLVEKQGDPIKQPIRRQPNKDVEKIKQEPASTAGTKRKADENGSEDVDDFGNWKLEDGRQRLHMFCQATSQPFEMKYTPDGNTPPRVFTAAIGIDVTVEGEKKRLEKSHTCVGKKQAAQHCALEMVKELYQLNLVEANVGIQQTKKKNPRQRNQFDGPMGHMLDQPPAPFSGPPMFPPGPMYMPYGPPPQRKTPYEDAIIFEKHRRIYPSEFELNLIQKTVRAIETALKQVSDHLSELEESSTDEDVKDEVKIKKEAGEKEKDASASSTAAKESKRVLQGVMRVGALAKGLLLRGDMSAHLVLLSVDIPSASLLTKISSQLSRMLEETGDKYLVELRISECCIHVSSPQEDNDKGEPSKCTVKVSLTSPLIRTIEPATGPADMLDRDKCIQSLAEIRHAKWFQSCANGLPSCVVLIRIFIDMKRRISTWGPLSDWALELIIEKSLSTSLFGQLTVGEGMRRVLSCISSGVLLEDGGGLYDPCEKIATDVVASVTPQEREDITESAHHALRMLVFRQTHKILGVEPMPLRVRRSTDGEQSSNTDVI